MPTYPQVPLDPRQAVSRASGTAAQRPANAPAGMIYEATDTGEVSIGRVGGKWAAARGGVQDVAYAATITPDPFLGSVIKVGTLTGNITVNVPAAAANIKGVEMVFVFTQDATGSRTVTFNGATWRKSFTASVGANTVSTVSFVYDGTNWVQTASATALA